MLASCLYIMDLSLAWCYEVILYHTDFIVIISKPLWWSILVISFINLLDTSTTWVDIFWMSLNLAKEAFQECIIFLIMEYVSLEKWRFHYLLYMLTAPRLILVLCCINGTSMRTWCHLEGSMSWSVRDLMGNKFFIIFVKYVNYSSG